MCLGEAAGIVYVGNRPAEDLFARIPQRFGEGAVALQDARRLGVDRSKAVRGILVQVVILRFGLGQRGIGRSQFTLRAVPFGDRRGQDDRRRRDRPHEDLQHQQRVVGRGRLVDKRRKGRKPLCRRRGQAAHQAPGVCDGDQREEHGERRGFARAEAERGPQQGRYH